MTQEQYNRMLPYKPIIELFVNSGAYIGGGDGLIDIYEEVNRCKINRQCADCIADMLRICYLNLKQFEK